MRNKCRHPDIRDSADFFTIDGPDWVVAIALTPDNKLVMVNQFRFGSESLSWEMPAGCINPAEDPVAAALRELAEETGYVPASATLVGTCRPNPALQSNRCHFVLCMDARRTRETEFDEFEELACTEMDVEAVKAAVREGTVHHALAIAALFYLPPAP